MASVDSKSVYYQSNCFKINRLPNSIQIYSNFILFYSKNLPNSNSHFSNYLRSSHLFSIYLFPKGFLELKRLIAEIKPKLSTGFDQIPPIVLRYLLDDALHALSYIFNLSLLHGKFPDALKKKKKKFYSKYYS